MLKLVVKRSHILDQNDLIEQFSTISRLINR